MVSNFIDHKYPDKTKLEQEFKALAEKSEVILENKLKTLSYNKTELQKGLHMINPYLARS